MKTNLYKVTATLIAGELVLQTTTYTDAVKENGAIRHRDLSHPCVRVSKLGKIETSFVNQLRADSPPFFTWHVYSLEKDLESNATRLQAHMNTHCTLLLSNADLVKRAVDSGFEHRFKTYQNHGS